MGDESPDNRSRVGRVSVVIVVDSTTHATAFAELVSDYLNALRREHSNLELVLVMDGPAPEIERSLPDVPLGDTPLVMVSFNRRFGEAAAIKAGFENATGEVILTLPAVTQVAATEVPKLLAPLDSADIVVARREGVERDRTHALRTWLLHGALNVITDNSLSDLECRARAFRREVLQQVQLRRESHLFLPVVARASGFTVCEIDLPVDPKSNNHSSSTGISAYIEKLFELFSLFFLINFAHRPLRFFGSIGLVLFAFGSAALALVIAQRLFFDVAAAGRPLLIIAAMTQMLGVQIVAFGLLGEILNFIHGRRSVRYSVKEVVGKLHGS